MNHSSILNTLFSAVQALEQSEKDSKEYLTASLAKKAEAIVQAHPYDVTSQGMLDFLTKRASAKPFITRAELQQVYRTLSQPNNVFAGYFGEELRDAAEIAKHEPKIAKATAVDVQENRDAVVDPFLVQTFAGLFDGGKVTGPSITKKVADQATSLCRMVLSGLEMSAKEVVVEAGNANGLVCRASFETPKGTTSVLIPMDIQNSIPLMPEKFMAGTSGLMPLKAENLMAHLRKNAGAKLHITASQLLENFSPAQEGEDFSAERALASLKLSQMEKNAGFLQQSVIASKIDEGPVAAISKPYFEETPEIKSFAEYLTNPAGQAHYLHGKLTKKAEEMLNYKLRSLGFASAQYHVIQASEKDITFGVQLGPKFAFKTSVMIDKKAEMAAEPTVIVSDGSVAEFSREGIESLQATAGVDLSAMRAAKSNFGPMEILAEIEESLVQGLNKKAEELLTVLQATGDTTALQTGFWMYQKAMKDGGSSLRKMAQAETSGCNKQIKVANSVQKVCGHLNLPLNRVYQDEHGYCRPIYRKYQEATGTAIPAINGSKVVFN